MIKSIFTSKVVWFNVITIVLAILALPEFISLISPVILPYIALINSIGNLVLRLYFTNSPITQIAADQNPPVDNG